MDNGLTVHQLIEQYAEKEPSHIAIREEGHAYTYRELNEKANQLAHYLQQFNVKPETVVAIAIERSAALLIGILGILKAGCAYLPLDATHPQKRLQFLLTDTQTAILITDSKEKDAFKDFSGHIILLDTEQNKISHQPSDNVISNATENNLAYIIYTSGSTGQPKGVLIEHKSVVNFIRWLGQFTECQPQDRVDFSSSIVFDMAVANTITAFALGLQVVICSDAVKKNVSRYLMYLKQTNIQLTKLTPSYFNVLVREAHIQGISLPGLKSLIVAGEILHKKDCQTWLERYPHHIIFNEYGPTEATVAITIYKMTAQMMGDLNEVIPIGKPGLNIDCKILTDKLQLTAPQETGELYISGICLARGYLNRDELNQKKFIPNPFPHEPTYEKLYRTGDLCRYLPDGNIEVVQRLDDQIKIRGYRIEPGEIEKNLTSHAQIEAAFVCARDLPNGDKQLIAYYIPKNPIQIPTSQALRDYLKESLADYMIPSFFVKIDAFPLTENGKLDKHALPEPTMEMTPTAPNTQIEKQLLKIWQKEFHLNEIGTYNHFIELGGHSLLAARIVVDIEKILGKKIQIEDIYKHPTIKALAPIIATAEDRHLKAVTTFAPVNSNSASNKIPLSDFQFVFWISNTFERKVKNLNIIRYKRMAEKLDMEAFKFALQYVIQRHQILSYQISKLFPLQSFKERKSLPLVEIDLTQQTTQETETILSNSLQDLLNQTHWPQHTPSMCVKVFYLKNEMTELQIAVPHIICDDASLSVLLDDLSQAYLSFKNGDRSLESNQADQYQDYIIHERSQLNQSIKTDIAFWQTYLAETALLKLPRAAIIKNMDNDVFSSYLNVPNDIIKNCQHLCMQASVSMTDLFCAAVTLALQKVSDPQNKEVYINIIRSTRSNEIEDKMVGCFIQIDPIKVDLGKKQNLMAFAKTIQQSRLETEPFQNCSGLVKLACLDTNYRKHPFKHSILSGLLTLYCKLFRSLKLNPMMLKMYFRLKPLRQSLSINQTFMVQMNILNDFITTNQSHALFGLPLAKTKMEKYDILAINDILDITFLKNEMNERYIVVSANLHDSFRQEIGKNILDTITAFDKQAVSMASS